MDMSHDACYRVIETRDARFDGRLFIGVKTTGVYCRPICPARTPKRENVTFFATATASQAAGFRPCLRCRPEASPDLAAWRGTSNTVARALALIETGALDGGDMAGLAARLGVGERQLRRMFRRHLGASPVAVAQTRRVLLAKQLIHQTRLPMTEVALASGFGSVRRFNETFQALYKRPPRALRRAGGDDVSARGGGWITLRLPYRAPYDWDGIIAFLALRAIEGVESVTPERYARAIAVGADRGLLIVTRGADDEIRVSVRFPKIAALPLIIAKVRRVFDLAADPEQIGAHLAGDPRLASLVAARPGLRVPGAWDGFELAVRAILGQQITVVAARNLAGRIVRDWGEALPSVMRDQIDGVTHVFPSAERLAAADLSVLPMPRARSASLESLARAVAADPALFGPRRGLDEAVAVLKALPGIGEWTAQYIAMREIREPDAFPSGDVALMRALQTDDGPRPTTVEMLSRAETWRPWRAYAALHLWASLAPPSAKSEVVNVKAAA